MRARPPRVRGTQSGRVRRGSGGRAIHHRGGPLTATPSSDDAAAAALAHRIALLALDKKANEVVILDVRGKTSYADYFLIASGDSERQVAAITEHIETQLRNDGVRPLGIEGQERCQWVLLDFGGVVVHLFYDEVRAFYDLEGLWTDVPRERVA